MATDDNGRRQIVARRIVGSADREDELSAIRYANNVKDPRFLICRAMGVHVPHIQANGQFKDWRRDHATGGVTVETHCDRCGQAMIRRLHSDYTPNGGWKILYERGEDGYLAKPGEGAGLTSRTGRATFRRMQFEGVPEVDTTTPRGRRTRKRG